jgi:hypothetical protein
MTGAFLAKIPETIAELQYNKKPRTMTERGKKWVSEIIVGRFHSLLNKTTTEWSG